MGKRKITCDNGSCKHHTRGGCDTCIKIDSSGKCKSFEKGFAYYFHIVWDALGNKNFIDIHRMQRVKSTSNVQRQRNRNSQSNNRRLNRWQQDSA